MLRKLKIPEVLRKHQYLICALIALTLFLYPFYLWYTPSFDGSYNLQIPKNIVSYHRYQSNVALFDCMITTGYPVLLPIAFVFFIFGFSFAGFKLIMLGFFFSFITGIYFATRSFFKRSETFLAVIAVFLTLYFLKIPKAIQLIFEVIGEVPATAFFLLSLVLISQQYSRHRKNLLPLCWGGLLFGLAVETKLIMVLAIPAAGLFFFLRAIRYGWGESARHFVIFGASMLLPIVLFAAFQISELGITGFAAHKKDLLMYIKSNPASGIEAGNQNVGFIKNKSISGLQGGLENLYNYFAAHLRVARADLKMPFYSWIVIAILLFYLARAFYREKNDIGCCLICFFLTYAAWWFSINGSFWVRHFIPGLLVLLVLLSFVAGIIIEKLRSGTNTLFCLIATVALCFSLNILNLGEAAVNLDIKTNREKFNRYMETVDFFKMNLSSSNIYYKGWWQVPEIALFSDSPFKNLKREAPAKNSDKNYLILSSTEKYYYPELYAIHKKLCSDEIVFQNDDFFICKLQ